MKKLFFIGIDISKHTIDVSYCTGPEGTYLGVFSNNEAGFKEMITALKKLTRHRKAGWFFCFENTGVYSKPLFAFLSNLNYKCREEMPLHLSQSLGMKREKTDEIDSLDICRYVFEKRDSIMTSDPLSNQMTKLRKALSYRDLLVRKKVSLELSLKDQKAALDSILYDRLKSINDQLLSLFKELIKEVNGLIESIIEEKESTATNHQLAQSVIGIGLVISAYIIAFSNNYECFGNARAFCCYCASEIKAYYNRRIGEGKEYGVVVNNIMNKLIHRVFAVVKRQIPYVALNRHMSKEVVHN